MLLDGRRAVELEPPGSQWHPFSSWVLGSAELLHGDHDRAIKAFERTAFLGRERQKPAACLALAQLSLLAAGRDDWSAEIRVLQLLSTHLSLAEIARELNISRNTVKSHVAGIYRKLQVTVRADAVRQARQRGLISS